MRRKIKVGDRITFKAATRDSYKKATRVVNGFDIDRPTVRYVGWSNFIVMPREVIEVHPASKA